MLVKLAGNRRKYVFYITAEEMYERYKGMMMHIAADVLGTWDMAEDVVQTSFVRIINVWDRIEHRSESESKALCAIVARNVARDILRKGSTNPLPEDYAEIGGYEPQEMLINKENMSRLMNCIESLNPIYRDVMLMKFYLEYGNHEIAKLLDISEELVRKRIERGRKLLKIALEKEAEKDAKY